MRHRHVTGGHITERHAASIAQTIGYYLGGNGSNGVPVPPDVLEHFVHSTQAAVVPWAGINSLPNNISIYGTSFN